MAVKETIAFIGSKKGIPPILEKLVEQHYPVIFVTGEGVEKRRLTEEFRKKDISSKVEILECPKNGCWEADIIAFAEPANFEMELVDQIRKFTTQKIVVFISELKAEKAAFSAEQLKEIQTALPHSKIVPVLLNSETATAFISGKDSESVEKVSFIMESLGYETGNKEQ